MGKKQAAGPTKATAKPKVNQVRVEFDDPAYERIQAQANRLKLSVSAYVRQAIMLRVEADERRGV